MKTKTTDGFSLVEVVLAIGIVSFALLAVMGLLPVGLKAVKNSNEQAGAANVLNAIAESVRAARPVSTNASGVVTYSGSFAGKTITFSDQATNISWTTLTLEGTEDPPTKRLSAWLNIYEAPKAPRPGRGTVTVAWSAAANPQWNQTTQTWSNAEGSLLSGFQFLPAR